MLLPVTLKCSLNLVVAPGYLCVTAVRGLACHACFVLFEQNKLLDTNCSKTEYSASLRVAILICDVEQVMLATLMDSSEALAPKKNAGIVKTRQKLEIAKIHAIVRFQPKVAAILNRGHSYM